MNHSKHKRAWAEISLKNLRHNYETLKARLPEGTRFLGVVKADAYGHGALPVSRELEKLGCAYLGVACIDEALTLREGGITAPILIMGYTDPLLTDKLIKNALTQTLYSPDLAAAYSAEAAALGKRLKVHIKLNSGMCRLGFDCRERASAMAEMLGILKLPGLDAEGIFTHFAVADEPDNPFTLEQFTVFSDFLQELEAKSGHHFVLKHCANSGAVINYPQMSIDMVRAGLALYGISPGGEFPDLDLRPVMSVRARVAQVTTIHPGDTVSYGRAYTAKETRRVAVVTFGYADGLFRPLSGQFDMLIHGKRARQIGRICMDMCMVDVTDIPDVTAGDTATIFGRDGDEFIGAKELTDTIQTIPYELLCAISPRVHRVYLSD
jgi:alanine racemase